MREIFFARDTFSLSGKGDFDGTFHLFRRWSNGRARTGRELKGTFSSDLAGVNAYRFGDLRGIGALGAGEAGGHRRVGAASTAARRAFGYRMAPLGVRGVPADTAFDAEYENVDLTAFTNFLELRGLRLAGRASGRNLLEWPPGRFADAPRRAARCASTPPPGVELMTRRMPVERIEARGATRRRAGARSAITRRASRCRSAATLAYAFGPEWIDIGPSRDGHAGAPTSSSRAAPRTASSRAFRSTSPSADWQESDRVFAGLLTAFGSPHQCDSDRRLRHASTA